jgi:ABC-type dipeptide/oligopeptide/nickel transport system permease component
MQAIFLVITFAVLIANLAIDLVLVLFDPRVRAREAAR